MSVLACSENKLTARRWRNTIDCRAVDAAILALGNRTKQEISLKRRTGPNLAYQRRQGRRQPVRRLGLLRKDSNVKTERFKIEDLTFDPRLQLRVEEDKELRAEYARKHKELPPIKVIWVEEHERTYVTDGWYTCHGKLDAGEKYVEGFVSKGTWADAVLAAGKGNRNHGKPWTNEDKWSVASAILAEWADKSDRWIADELGFSHAFIGKVRASLKPKSVDLESTPNLEEIPDSPLTTAPMSSPEVPDDPDKMPGIPMELRANCPRCRGKEKACNGCNAQFDRPLDFDEPIMCKNCARKGPRNGGCEACDEARRLACGNGKPKTKKKKTTVKSDKLEDALKQPIPEPLRDLFGDPWLNDLISGIRERIDGLTSARIASGIRNKGAAYAQYFRVADALKNLENAVEALEHLEETLKASLPHSVCPVCAGKGCNAIAKGKGCGCRNAGWMPEWRLNEHRGEVA